jgi:CRP/FNR family cyclic AMP-dependent transcriptional regulator
VRLDTEMPLNKDDNARARLAEKSSVLRNYPAFRDLEPAALDQLCRYAKHTKFKRGAEIFSKGDPGTSLYAVVSGTVRMSTASAEGRTALLNLIVPGDIFGEIAVLDGLPRTTDAIANSNCELLIIDRRDFLPFLRGQPELAMRIIELLCARLRWTSEHVEQMILNNLPARLANTIVRLAERHHSEASPYGIEMTQQRVSEMAGMSRESVNKLLSVWAADKWVRLEHGTLMVLDMDALKAVAGEI